MIAILSDVHANLEALQAVYQDLVKRRIRRIFFLGDIIGYGPNPIEVLEFIKHFEFCLLGNHDEAVLLGPPKSFNTYAQRATWWTRSQLCPDELAAAFLRPAEYRRREEYWEFLSKLKPVRLVGETMFVHDNPVRPGAWRYVRTREDADKGFRARPEIRAFFLGHSHQPVVWTEDERIVPEPGQKFAFSQRVIVNVGSVGQPRDKDPRACYVVLEPDGFRFFRVPYDVARTQEKILANPELDPILAERLAKGV
jgi:diadenosine tetraphosphatase ApaH/serine/threonine PP2A family protein phosphatase